MSIIRSRFILLGMCVCAGLQPVATSAADAPDNHQHAHVHGIATLGIAVQDDVVTLSLESPLDSLIGFEHRAGTTAERAAVAQLQARLKSPGDLFRLPAEAACTVSKTEAESAIFDPPPATAGDGHADLDASFEFRCAHIERLASIDVGLFAAYPRLQKINAEVATAHGQFKRELTKAAHVVVLGS